MTPPRTFDLSRLDPRVEIERSCLPDTLAARGRSPEGRVTAKRGRILGGDEAPTRSRDEAPTRSRDEAPTVAKKRRPEAAKKRQCAFIARRQRQRRRPRFAVTLWAQGSHRRFKRRPQAPRRLCPALVRPGTMKRRRLRPRFQTSVPAPHFAQPTRRPLRAVLGTSATGCWGFPTLNRP